MSYRNLHRLIGSMLGEAPAAFYPSPARLHNQHPLARFYRTSMRSSRMTGSGLGRQLYGLAKTGHQVEPDA